METRERTYNQIVWKYQDGSEEVLVDGSFSQSFDTVEKGSSVVGYIAGTPGVNITISGKRVK